MGLVQRAIEAANVTTISLSHIPTLTASVGVPRLVGIERPSGLNVGLPGDQAGQMAVLRATLDALAEMSEPGMLINLPFEWVEPAEKLNVHPPKTPPIGQYIVRHPWALPRLLQRNPGCP